MGATLANTNFDGDQMAVHLPLSIEAQVEAHTLLLATNNIFSPANGAPIMSPSQDVVMGCYYITMELPGLKHQVCVTMMALPPGCVGAHDPTFYAKTLDDILEAEIPFTSVCFKDASGTAYPATIYETVKAARKRLPEGTRLSFHTHEYFRGPRTPFRRRRVL